MRKPTFHKVKLINNLINDLSSKNFHSEDDQKRNKYILVAYQFKNKVYEQLSKIIIFPSSKFNLFWDCFMALFIIVIIFMECLKIFFLIPEKDKENFPTNTYPLKMLTFGLFIFDGVKNFFTAYYHMASLITDHKKISQAYLSGHFLFDLISLLAYFTSSSHYL